MATRTKEKVSLVKCVPYVICNDGTHACDWRWPTADPIWNMSIKEGGVSWKKDSALNENGRNLILAHFGLDLIADKLPLETIRGMSPRRLIGKRRELEAKDPVLPKLNPTSTRGTGSIPAAQAA